MPEAAILLHNAASKRPHLARPLPKAAILLQSACKQTATYGAIRARSGHSLATGLWRPGPRAGRAATGVPLNSLGVVQDNPSSAEAIEPMLKALCDGSAAFSAIRMVFLDPQTEFLDCSWHFDAAMVRSGGMVSVLGVDNKDLTALQSYCCTNRS